MIEVTGLKKAFGDKVVLDDLTFSVAPGEIYGLLGPNGAGKTTVINILCNLLDADGGTVMVEGKPVTEATKNQLGIVSQEVAVYKDLTCEENLRFFASLYGLRGVGKSARVDELLRIFQLTDYATIKVSILSGGWQRRIHIAIALVHSPAILILDEPTAGLDVEARFELWESIGNLRSMGVTILLTTHYLEEAEKLCSRLGILRKGRMAAEGSPDELRAKIPASELAVIETKDEKAICQKASSLGWQHRYYGGKLTFWLPRRFSLKEIVDTFDGLPLSSVSLQPVRLEHVYMEVSRE
jgi:ABC-2 type transport system ATP-binding protein